MTSLRSKRVAIITFFRSVWLVRAIVFRGFHLFLPHHLNMSDVFFSCRQEGKFPHEYETKSRDYKTTRPHKFSATPIDSNLEEKKMIIMCRQTKKKNKTKQNKNLGAGYFALMKSDSRKTADVDRSMEAIDRSHSTCHD